MKRLLQWLWPWPQRIRRLEAENARLRLELEKMGEQAVTIHLHHTKVTEECEALRGTKDKLEARQGEMRRAMAVLGVFIKRRHGLNLPESRLHQFTQ